MDLLQLIPKITFAPNYYLDAKERNKMQPLNEARTRAESKLHQIFIQEIKFIQEFIHFGLKSHNDQRLSLLHQEHIHYALHYVLSSFWLVCLFNNNE